MDKEPLDYSVWVSAGMHVSYLVWAASREINPSADEIVPEIRVS
jgi:hypothetical protein